MTDPRAPINALHPEDAVLLEFMQFQIAGICSVFGNQPQPRDPLRDQTVPTSTGSDWRRNCSAQEQFLREARAE